MFRASGTWEAFDGSAIINRLTSEATAAGLNLSFMRTASFGLWAQAVRTQAVQPV
jgi:hypothetical protein